MKRNRVQCQMPLTKTSRMIFNFVTILFCFCFASTVYSLSVYDEKAALCYLEKFGHLKKTTSGTFNEESVSSAISDFQKFAGLPETGQLDSKTIARMNVPRCVFEKKMRNHTMEEERKKAAEEEKKKAAEEERKKAEEEERKKAAEEERKKAAEEERKKAAEEEKKDTKEPEKVPDICKDATLDTITRTNDGTTYAFKGDYYWKINYNVVPAGYPKRIADDWGGLEGNLDASFTGLGGKTFFFKGKRYWRFTNKIRESGYPKLISEGFKGIPDNLDAALTWGRNGKPYFFKGGQFWRYDVGANPPVNPAYPSSITEWRGLPVDGIDAAFLWEKNLSYFFKGGQYYLFDDATSQVSKQYNYPASTASGWFSCGQLP